MKKKAQKSSPKQNIISQIQTDFFPNNTVV